MNIKSLKYYYKNIFYVSNVVVFKTILNLGTLLILTSIATQEEYGYVVLVSTILGTLNFLGVTGLDPIITRNTLKGNDRFFLKSVKYSFKISLFITPILIVIALFYNTSNDINFVYTLIILSFIKPFHFASKKWTSFLHGKKRFFRSSLFQILVSLDGYFALFFLFYYGNIWYYIIALNIFDTFISFVAFYNSLQYINSKSNNSDFNLEQERQYANFLSIINILVTIIKYIDKVIIAVFVGVINLSIYAISNRLITIIKDLLKGIVTVPSLKLAELEKEVYSSKLKSYIFVILIVSVFMTAFIFYSGEVVISFLFPKYKESISYFQLNSLVFLFTPTSLFIAKYLTLNALLEDLSFITITSNFLSLFLFLLMFYYYGIIGIIFALVIVELYKLILYVLILFNKIKLPKLSYLESYN